MFDIINKAMMNSCPHIFSQYTQIVELLIRSTGGNFFRKHFLSNDRHSFNTAKQNESQSCQTHVNITRVNILIYNLPSFQKFNPKYGLMEV